MKTKVLKKANIKRQWYIIDADNRILGRLASRISRILTGKHKAQYTPHVDCGDFVIILNADKFRVSGKKMTDKIYYSHSFYPGGLKQINLANTIKKHPGRAIYHAVSGMLPKNRLRAKRLKRLKIYPTGVHPHKAQNPVELNVCKEK